MCLDRVSSRKPKPTGTGWKVFAQHSDGSLKGYFYKELRVTGVWLRSEALVDRWHGVPISLHRTPRPCDIGFHIYTCKKDATTILQTAADWGWKNVLRKVKYRGAHAIGVGDGGWNPEAQVVVAREIKIL